MPDLDRDLQRLLDSMDARIRALENDAPSVPVRFAIGSGGGASDFDVVIEDTWGGVLAVTPEKDAAIGFGLNDKTFGAWCKNEWILLSDYLTGGS